MLFFWCVVHQAKPLKQALVRYLGRSSSSFLPTHRHGSLSSSRSRFGDVKITSKSFHIRLETTTLNVLYDSLSLHLNRSPLAGRFVRTFYDMGSIAGVIGMVTALVVLVWAAQQITGQILQGFTSVKSSEPAVLAKRAFSTFSEARPEDSDMILQPMVSHIPFL